MAVGDLTTLGKVRGWLELASPLIEDDAILARLITAQSSLIKNWLNRDIISQNYTEDFSGKGTYVVNLPQYPITAVSTLYIDGRAVTPSPDAQTSGYVVNDQRIFLRGGLKFTVGILNVSVAYTAGYSALPGDIEQACIELCALRYKERDRIGNVSKSIAGETIAYSQKDMPADVMTLLQQYKKVVPV